MSQTNESFQQRLNKANQRLKNYIIASMGVSLIPMPIVDLFLVTGVQLKMLHSLAKLYNVPFKKDVGKSLIASLLGGAVPSTSALGVTTAATTATATASITKAIPGIGTVAGVATMSVLAGAATYAICKVFIQHFESGGTFLDFDPESVREYFSDLFKEGKQVVNDIKETASAGVTGKDTAAAAGAKG